MRKLYFFLVTASAFIGWISAAAAFEAMLGGTFGLHPHPHSRQHITTLGAGEIVDIDRCDRSWCLVRHNEHTGYVYLPRVLDGNVYGSRTGGGGYGDGGLAGVGADIVTAPVSAADQAINAGVSILR